jgi:enoyl-CoA hydratase/carnithine racemase
MDKLNLDTENFESRVTGGVVVARFKEQAMDILTDIDAGSGFLDFLEQVNDETDVPGYVQVNDGAWDSHTDVDKLGQFFSENEDMHIRDGRDYGYLHDVVAARFRNTIGRYLHTLVIFSKPIIAGYQGRISAEYLGLSLAFDARFAAANTTFAFENVRSGIPASPGITHLMPQYIGLGRTLALANQGDTINAEQALELGLISGIIDDGQDLTQVCVEYIQTLSKHHHEVLQSNRQSILPSAEDISTALDKYYLSMGKVIANRRARAKAGS